MDQRTRDALLKSIDKWQAIVNGGPIKLGPKACPLCQEFRETRNSAALVTCPGCPVAERTGHPGCAYTPYDDCEANEPLDDDPGQMEIFLHHAKRELEFLKSLLPGAPALGPTSYWSVMVECRKQGAIGTFTRTEFKVRADYAFQAIKYAISDAQHDGWETRFADATNISREQYEKT